KEQRILETDARFSEYQMHKYYKNDTFDLSLMLQDFQQFWRENSDIWQNKYQYRESAPHLILQAFLQRVLNGGGDIRREMATGRRRLDLCVEYLGKKYPIEIKINYGKKYLERGTEQLLNYMDILGCKEGWLVAFDRNAKKSWEDKIYQKSEEKEGKTVNIFGC
ncbi:MAG: hypothetical protein FWH18_09110, partial [Marinilabiliaceae bacterium]|nr:hypothetical protein [Marinilabiliaceae bacterium]